MTPPSPSITNGSITSCLTCRNCNLEHIVYYGITAPHSLYLFYYHWQINGFRLQTSVPVVGWRGSTHMTNGPVYRMTTFTTFQCTWEEVERLAISHAVHFPRVSSGHLIIKTGHPIKIIIPLLSGCSRIKGWGSQLHTSQPSQNNVSISCSFQNNDHFLKIVTDFISFHCLLPPFTSNFLNRCREVFSKILALIGELISDAKI